MSPTMTMAAEDCAMPQSPCALYQSRRLSLSPSSSSEDATEMKIKSVWNGTEVVFRPRTRLVSVGSSASRGLALRTVRSTSSDVDTRSYAGQLLQGAEFDGLSFIEPVSFESLCDVSNPEFVTTLGQEFQKSPKEFQKSSEESQGSAQDFQSLSFIKPVSFETLCDTSAPDFVTTLGQDFQKSPKEFQKSSEEFQGSAQDFQSLSFIEPVSFETLCDASAPDFVTTSTLGQELQKSPKEFQKSSEEFQGSAQDFQSSGQDYLRCSSVREHRAKSEGFINRGRAFKRPKRREARRASDTVAPTSDILNMATKQRLSVDNGGCSTPRQCKSARQSSHSISGKAFSGLLQLFASSKKRGTKLKEVETESKRNMRVSMERLADWQQSLSLCLDDEVGCREYTEFAAAEYSGENMMFWTSCKAYSANPTLERAEFIHDQHIREAATFQVNINYSCRKHIEERYRHPDPDGTLLNEAFAQVVELMSKDSYRRFLKSPTFLAYLSKAAS